jgi:flagellar biosynthesis protein FlhB
MKGVRTTTHDIEMSEKSDLKVATSTYESDAEEMGKSSRGTILAGLLGLLALLIALILTVLEVAERHHEFVKQDSIVCKGVEHTSDSMHYKVHYLIEVCGVSLAAGFGTVLLGILALTLLVCALSFAFAPLITETNLGPSTPRKLQ